MNTRQLSGSVVVAAACLSEVAHAGEFYRTVSMTLVPSGAARLLGGSTTNPVTGPRPTLWLLPEVLQTNQPFDLLISASYPAGGLIPPGDVISVLGQAYNRSGETWNAFEVILGTGFGEDFHELSVGQDPHIGGWGGGGSGVNIHRGRADNLAVLPTGSNESIFYYNYIDIVLPYQQPAEFTLRMMAIPTPAALPALGVVAVIAVMRRKR